MDWVQSVGVVAAVLVSAYAVLATELSRKLAARRLRMERVLEAVLGLAEAAVRIQEIQGQGAQYEIARLRLAAAIEIVGIDGLEHTELMTRSAASPADVRAQSEQAILELGTRLKELDPRPLWKRQRRVDFRARQVRA